MRRILQVILCLLMAFGSANAAMCVRMEDGAALLREDGVEIVPAGEYADIVSLGGGCFAAQQQGGRYALMDADGLLRTEAVYDALCLAESGDAALVPTGSARAEGVSANGDGANADRAEATLLIAQRDGSWGLLGADGAERSAFEYGQIVPTGAGGFWAIRGSADDMDSDAIYLLDEDGQEVETGVFVRKMGRKAGDGLLPALMPGTGLWGYLDAQGRVAIAARYSYAGGFVSGRAVVVLNGRYGAIDAQGRALTEPDYDYMEISPLGFILAARAQEGAWVLGPDGQEIASYEGENCSAALVGGGYAVADDDALRVYDADGQLLAESGPNAAVMEGLDGQFILSDGMWGERCVRLLGTDAAYQNLYPLGMSGGSAVYACMEANAARYVNDLLGEIQLSVDMETARYGIVDANGVQRLPCNYESIECLGDDRFLVYTEAGWQVIGLDGRVYWSRAATKTEAPSS